MTSGVVLAQNNAKQQPENNQPQQEAPPPQAPKVTPGTPDPNTTGAAVDPKTYTLGAEDIIFIRVFRDTDFSGTYGIRPDGKITLPLIGDMQAEGLTPERLAAQIKQALSDLIIKPEVTVMVLQVNSKKYTVSGEINRPGVYPLVTPTKVFDALNGAGGFRDFANKKDIVILRNGGAKIFKFNYNDIVKGKKLDQNIFLQNGDTIIVK